MGYTLFLDDTRNIDDILNMTSINKADHELIILVEDYNQFVSRIKGWGLPNFISFDHDLGLSDAEIVNGIIYGKQSLEGEKSGLDCAKWLVNYCIENGFNLPKWNVHSANSVGKKNIEEYLHFAVKRGFVSE